MIFLLSRTFISGLGVTGEDVREFHEELDEDSLETDGLSVGDVVQMTENVAQGKKQVGEEPKPIPLHVRVWRSRWRRD